MRLFVKLTTIELRLMLREPMSAFFGFLFPTVLVAILGCVPSFREPSADLGGLRVIDVYVGISVTMAIALIGIQMLPAVLGAYREQGVLRRFATTPVRPVTLLAAQTAASLRTAVIAATLAITVVRVVFGVPLPENFVGYLLSFLLCVAGVFAIGLLIAAFAPSAKSANAIGTLLFFPSMFFAGLWTPREVMPGILQRIGDFTALGAGERALHETMTGQWPNLLSATVLTAYLVLFGLGAARLFRWS